MIVLLIGLVMTLGLLIYIAPILILLTKPEHPQKLAVVLMNIIGAPLSFGVLWIAALVISVWKFK